MFNIKSNEFVIYKLMGLGIQRYIKKEVLGRRMRGRPTFSRIRQNIMEILNIMQRGYGYEIYQAYKEIFPEVTMRSIYTQLKKGVALGEFEVDCVAREKGDYSWGPEAEKVYYRLGRNASPKGSERVSRFLENKDSLISGEKRPE